MRKRVENLDEAYREWIGPLSRLARRHLCDKDWNLDCVHEAFKKMLGRKRLEYYAYSILAQEVVRCSARYNKWRNTDPADPKIEYWDDIRVDPEISWFDSMIGGARG